MQYNIFQYYPILYADFHTLKYKQAKNAHLFIRTRKATSIKILAPPPFIQEWNKWTPNKANNKGKIEYILKHNNYIIKCLYSKARLFIIG